MNLFSCHNYLSATAAGQKPPRGCSQGSRGHRQADSQGAAGAAAGCSVQQAGLHSAQGPGHCSRQVLEAR